MSSIIGLWTLIPQHKTDCTLCLKEVHWLTNLEYKLVGTFLWFLHKCHLTNLYTFVINQQICWIFFFFVVLFPWKNSPCIGKTISIKWLYLILPILCILQNMHMVEFFFTVFFLLFWINISADIFSVTWPQL